MLKACVVFQFSIVVILVSAGCSQSPVETGPSYSELVVTYNAELEVLDRLESKREKLASEYALAIKPSGGDSLKGLLEAASELQSEGEIDPNADPNALLDQLADRSSNAEELAGNLIGGLRGGQTDKDTSRAQPTEEQTAALEEIKAKYEPQIAELDKEIKSQNSRVDRARDARDAAETKSE